MNVNLIGVPINYGCDKEGAQYGPTKLRENNIVEVMKRGGHQIYDLGDIDVPFICQEDKYACHEKMKYLSPIAEINTNLAHEVYCSLSGKSFPFVIGGDHALGLGSIAGCSKYFKEIAVIWVDAHGDINSYETSPSGNIHGMPLAASMGIGHPILTNVYFEGTKVKPENVYIVGARDLDQGEIELAKKLNLNLYTIDIVKNRGLENVITEIINKIKDSNVNGVHLSFDIDVLDKSIVPGTGTAVDNGFNVEEGKFLFDKFLGEGFITSMDFVELNPKLDIDDRTTKVCIEMIDHIFKTI